ncbi:MAG: phosphoenolpyruvate carboxykinase [Candidatus Omnitrophica bacterium]|nr:phosphoenolpyruvate carboxykinase [Candidatus Omnitrophota bacterium]
MQNLSYSFLDKKIIIRIKNRICESSDELFDSALCRQVVTRCVKELAKRQSLLARPFGALDVTKDKIQVFIETLRFLAKMDVDLVPKVVKGADGFLKDKVLFNDLIEHLYNFWRSFDRFIICDSTGFDLDQKPYRTFNTTIEHLMHLIRATYRDIQENLTGFHPKIYRQVRSGASVAAIAQGRPLWQGETFYAKLNAIAVMSQILLYPPLILEPPMNKRTGKFERVMVNPLERLTIDAKEWLGYPAKVGELIILIYFHNKFAELGFSLCNLFELADEKDLTRPPDAVFCYGVPRRLVEGLGASPTVFFDDEENQLLVGAIPEDDEFGYFGYLKKMVLTLHNIVMMKRGRLPYHGAMVRVILKGGRAATILMIGDTGAGKSETLEAFRAIGQDEIQDLIIIADDMGSLQIDSQGQIIGYGTETGAFLRVDDLKPGYAFGQIDRAIIMSPSKINARIILPVTTFNNVIQGFGVDMVLYVNNYEDVDDDHPVIERLKDKDQAMNVFREGTVMSKGTTTTTGIVHSYYANVFGPPQYKDLHEKLAQKYFTAIFKKNIFVGQMRTRLGLPGYEQSGPAEAARQLLALIRGNNR